MAQKMYSRQEVEALDVDGVVKFAQEQGLDQEDVAVLRKQKIDGSVLERLNMDKLMKAGMKMGPAEKLMKALDKVFGRGSGPASGDTENKGQVQDKMISVLEAVSGNLARLELVIAESMVPKSAVGDSLSVQAAGPLGNEVRRWSRLEFSGRVAGNVMLLRDRPGRCDLVYPTLSGVSSFALKVGVSCAEACTVRTISCVEGVVPTSVLLTEHGDFALLMPLCIPLHKLAGRLCDRERLEIGLSMIRTLDAIHELGIMHCDVKPHNMFVARWNATTEPLLGDFGSACTSCASDKENGRHTFNGTSMFCVSRSDPPSARRDFQSLCMSLAWLRKPWRSRNGAPSWGTLLRDPIVSKVWAACSKRMLR